MSKPVALLPCPFCGSSGEIKEDCGTFEPGCSHCGSFFGFHSTRDHAAKSWNRRAPDPRVRELVEAAKQFDQTYGWHWDRTDGAAIIMPDRVADLEARYSRLAAALAAFQQDTGEGA